MITVHIFCDSNKTRESCVHIGYFIHLEVFMCFYKIVFTGTQISEYFHCRVFGSQNIQKCTALQTFYY